MSGGVHIEASKTAGVLLDVLCNLFLTGRYKEKKHPSIESHTDNQQTSITISCNSPFCFIFYPSIVFNVKSITFGFGYSGSLTMFSMDKTVKTKTYRHGYNVFFGGHINNHVSCFVRFTHLFPNNDGHQHGFMLTVNFIVSNNRKAPFKIGFIGNVGYSRDRVDVAPKG